VESGEPKEIHAIAFGKIDPASGLSIGGSEPLMIELDPSKGHWLVQHDKVMGNLNISFEDLV
jgi:streptogramin lyase